MTYAQSAARRRWTHERLARIDVLATAHASVRKISGPGRPLSTSKPVAHAYIIGMLSEFQGFTRNLHDLAVQRLVETSGAGIRYRAILIGGMTAGRGIDRGNATTAALRTDFARTGLTPLEIGRYNSRWGKGDAGAFDKLTQLRNVLGHGNETELETLLESRKVRDTVSWARSQRPLLNRYVRALDMLVWDPLVASVGRSPWT